MSTYRSTSSRYRVNGYRSQPVSNRNSLYFSSSDYGSNSTSIGYGSYRSSSSTSTDTSDFDRQFKRLLERTEKFTNRVERLHNTASSLSKGFRQIDRTVTGRIYCIANLNLILLIKRHYRKYTNKNLPSRCLLFKI